MFPHVDVPKVKCMTKVLYIISRDVLGDVNKVKCITEVMCFFLGILLHVNVPKVKCILKVPCDL